MKRGNKRNIIGICLILAIVIITLSYSSTTSPTGKAIFEPDTPIECNNENITAVWETIFVSTLNPVPLRIIFDDDLQTGHCDSYLAYVPEDPAVSQLSTLILIGKETVERGKEIIAINGNFVPEFINFINQIEPENLSTLTYELTVEDLIANSSRWRETTLAGANDTFKQIFNVEPSIWTSDPLGNFYESYESRNDLIFSRSISAQIGSVDMYYFSKKPQPDDPAPTDPPACTPNWTKYIPICAVGDTMTAYYFDIEECNDNTNKPANETIRCDFNSNNIIGSISDTTVSRITMEIKIADEELDQLRTYTGKNNVTILDDNKTIIEFELNFSSTPLDLFNIEIKKQSSTSDFGYLIIEGIATNKTVKVDKLDSNSTSVCIKNSSVSSINSVSDDCDDSDEYIVPCPGTNGSFICSISGSQFIISGLENSAVMEIVEGSTTSTIASISCNSSWNCTTLSACVNNTQTRTCVDNNLCVDNSTKPNETITCGACYPNWDCTDWSPSECPSSETQTRTCSDLNICGTTDGKPAESLSCTVAASSNGEDDSSSMTYLIIVIGLIVLGGVGWIALKYLNKEPTGTLPLNPSMPPAAPPSARPATMQRSGQPPRKMPPRRPPQNPNIRRPIK